MASDRCPLYSRRQFLTGLGAVITLTACSKQAVTVYTRSTTIPTSVLTPGTSSRPLPTPPPGTAPVADRTLVVVELGGGNDSLSTVVPLTERYRDLRPTTAVTDPIALDREIGLHPNLATVADLYSRGQVAIVEGLGMADPDLSHFVSMRRWWDGTDRPDHTGWLGRYLDATVGYDDVLAGVSIGPSPSPAMMGNASFVVAVADASGLARDFPWWVDDVRDFTGIWAGFAPASVPVAELDPVRRAIATTAGAQLELARSLGPLGRTLERLDLDTYRLSGQLALAGGLVASEVRPQVIYVHGATDFDTHEDQVARHGELMAELDLGLARFFDLVDEAGVGDRVVVMTTSEFGRRAADNDGGTDHGTAATHFVVGPAVQGGRYGETPSLRRLDADGNLIPTVDFRSLYASVLEGWLGAGAEDILRGSYESLALFPA